MSSFFSLDHKFFSWAVAAKIFFVLYCFLLLSGIMHHEPWRDETQAWLLARDQGFLHILKSLSTEGAMPLWHMILFAFSKVGLPFHSIYGANYFFSVTAAYILLFRSPFHTLTSISVLMGSALLYNFSVIARHYALSTCILFWVLTVFPDRHTRSYSYLLSLILLLLSNTFALAIGIVLLGELALGNKKNRKNILYVFFGTFIMVGIYAYPRVLEHYNDMISDCCSKTFGVINWWFWGSKIWSVLFNSYAAILALFAWSFFGRERLGKVVAVLLCANIIWFFYICHIGYTCGFYHQLNLLIYIVAGAWLLCQKATLEKSQRLFINALICFMCLITVPKAIQQIMYDHQHNYSASMAMAGYIDAHIPEKSIIATDSPVETTVVLPYLTDRKLYSIGIAAFVTYFDYDKDYLTFYRNKNYKRSFDGLIDRYYGSGKALYFLTTDVHLDKPKNEKEFKNHEHKLKHLTKVHSVRGKQESLYLFRVTPVGQE
jgi:hypothetical protein